MAVKFNSASDYYTVSGSSDFNMSDSADWAYVIVARRTGITNIFGYMLSSGTYQTTNSLNINLSTYQDSSYLSQSTVTSWFRYSPWLQNQWQVYVYQPNSAGTQLEFLTANVDGTETPSVTATVDNDSQIRYASDISALTMHIGGRSDQDSARFFDGEIYMVAKLNQRLSTTQVQNIAAGQHLIDDMLLSPLMYLIFSANDATIYDETANGHDATMVGSVTTATDPSFPSTPTEELTVTEPSNWFVWQRRSGQRTVAFSGTYSGAPTAIEARVVEHGTDTPISGLDWQTIDDSPSDGVWSGILSVPATDTWYNIDVRWANDTGIIANGNNRWGVGDVILLYGQSQMEWSWEHDYGTVITPSDMAAFVDPNVGVYQQSPTNRYVSLMLNNIIAETGLPTMAIGAAVGAQTIADLSKGAATGIYDNMIPYVNDSDCAFVWLNQGGNDVTESTPISTYETSLYQLVADLEADLIGTFTFGLSILANRTSGTDAQVAGIRGVQIDYLDDNPTTICIGSNQDMSLVDGVHPNAAGMVKEVERMALGVLKSLGLSSYDGRGPEVSSLQFNTEDKTITFTFSLNGGSSIIVDSGDPAAIEVYGNGVASQPDSWVVSGNTIVGTYTTALPDTPITAQIAYGLSPTGNNPWVNARNNYTEYTSIGLPISPTSEAIVATEESTNPVSPSTEDNLYAFFKNLSYAGALVDMWYNWLGDQGYTGSLEDRMYAWLEDEGYSGSLPDKFYQYWLEH